MLRFPDRARALVLVDAALGLTATPSDAPALLHPKWLREVLVSLTVTNPLATKMLLKSLIAKKDRALPEYVEILQRPSPGRTAHPTLPTGCIISWAPIAAPRAPTAAPMHA